MPLLGTLDQHIADSSENVCIENSNISTTYDAIALKSGWDEYGISYDKPITNVHIRGVHLQSFIGSGIAFGSEMSGGISNIRVEDFQVHDSFIGVELKTARGRGGYIKDIVISKGIMENVHQAIKATSLIDTHPDDKYDPSALPFVNDITFKDIVGTGITTAGNFTGISESPFSDICLSNVLFSVTSADPYTSWVCSYVSGSSTNVSPEPCLELQNVLSACSSSHQTSSVATL